MKSEKGKGRIVARNSRVRSTRVRSRNRGAAVGALVAARKAVVEETLRLRDSIGPLKNFSVSRTVRSMREGGDS